MSTKNPLMSLIIWAACSQGLLLACNRQEPPKIFCATNRSSILFSVTGDRPEWNYGLQIVSYLENNEVDLASSLHVEALRTVLCQKLEPFVSADVTLALGQNNHDHSGIVLLRIICHKGKARVQGQETREYGLESGSEFVPLGEDAGFFLSRVAQNPKYLKTLRKNQTTTVGQLSRSLAVKIAEEMIVDTARVGAKGLSSEVDVHCILANKVVNCR